MKESSHFYRIVHTEEYYLEENGKVFKMWRFVGEDGWRKELTPYCELPIVSFRSNKKPKVIKKEKNEQ